MRGALDGAPVAFELRKFGFTVIRPEGRDDLDPRILGQLPSALREVEVFLRPLAEQQVANGHVLITNRYSEFNDRYHFFAIMRIGRIKEVSNHLEGKKKQSLTIAGECRSATQRAI
ncbi:hypothetical protein ACFSLT_28865 [Novosphingobium resinovorum]